MITFLKILSGAVVWLIITLVFSGHNYSDTTLLIVGWLGSCLAFIFNGFISGLFES